MRVTSHLFCFHLGCLVLLGVGMAGFRLSDYSDGTENSDRLEALVSYFMLIYTAFAVFSTLGWALLLKHNAALPPSRPESPVSEPPQKSAQVAQIATLVRTLALQRKSLHDEGEDRRRAEKALQDCEEKLRQAQKMEAVGRLASGIAHDFNNLLTAILGYSGLIQTESADRPSVMSHATEIIKAGEHAGCLTHQLLSFSRQHGLEPRTLNLNDLMLGMQGMIRRLIGEVIDLRIHPSEDCLWMRADRTQVQQVILNLAVNARDAMPHGGQLTISGSRCAVPEINSLGLNAGEFVTLTFEDTGEGISPEVLAKIFEPFFTTKAVGKGTGLGLATVFGIAESNGGAIDVESTVGLGTKFIIYLPATESDARVDGVEMATASAAAAITSRPQRVLVVEDDEIVCQLVCRVLEDRGYEVLSATDGEEALEFGEETLRGMDLLIADVVMPRLGGVELSRRLRQQRPNLPVVLMSGYSETDLRKFSEVDEGSNILKKPFGPEILTRRVREALDLQSVL